MRALAAFGLCVLSTSAAAQHEPTSELTLTATSANVSEVGSPVKIHVLRWSTDEECRPMIAALNPRPPVAAPAGAVRGTAGRGGRGRGGARGGGEAAPLTPMAALAGALGKAPTLGCIWTDDITGYSIKYARRVSLPGGGERIIVATNRRLGAYTTAWKPVDATLVSDDELTLIEIHLNATGSGEGKASLMTKVIVDQDATTIALDNYGATPAILENVKHK